MTFIGKEESCVFKSVCVDEDYMDGDENSNIVYINIRIKKRFR